MIRNNTAWALAAAVGALVIFGWVADIEILTKGYPGWVSMKMLTAFCFILIGVAGMASKATEVGRTVTQFLSTTVIALCWYTLGAESITVFNPNDFEYLSRGVGIPSIATVVMFNAMAICLMLRSHNVTSGKILGPFIVALTTLPFVGYAFGIPALFYYFDGVSTAMAIHTAITGNVIGFKLSKDALVEGKV